MKITQTRPFQIFFETIILSLCVVAVFRLNLLRQNQYNMLFVCLIACGLFFFLEIVALRRSVMELVHRKKFYKHSFTAFGIFAVVCMLFAFLAPVKIFSLLFSFTKVFRYLYEPMDYRLSAVLFILLYGVITAIAPFTLSANDRKRLKEIIYNQETHTARRNSAKTKKRHFRYWNQGL